MVRYKNRYIVVEANSENQVKAGLKENTLIINGTKLFNAIITKLEQLHGDYGVAAIRNGFSVKYVNEKTRIALIKVRHGPHQLILSCLPFIQAIDKKNICLNVLYVGATIKQCFRFVVNYQKRKVDEICFRSKSEAERKDVEKVLLNFEAFKLL